MHQMDSFALPGTKLMRREAQAEIHFLARIQQGFELFKFSGTEIWRHIITGTARKSAEELQRGETREKQHRAYHNNRDEIKSHRFRIFFTVLLYCRTSASICSGVRPETRLCTALSGWGVRKVNSQTTTARVYAIGGVIRTT